MSGTPIQTAPVVFVHKSFFKGNSAIPFLVDFNNMSTQEKEALAKMLSDISTGASHPGRNKPSWLVKPGERVSGPYLANNVWHYHCGPSFSVGTGATLTPPDLPHNETGLTSPECVHYSKKRKVPPQPERDYTVLGFSSDHRPFKKDTDRDNPLKPRVTTVGDSHLAA